MNVRKLKKLLEKIPDNYEIRTSSCNAYLDNDKSSWQLCFSGEITKIKPIHLHRILMLIREFE